MRSQPSIAWLFNGAALDIFTSFQPKLDYCITPVLIAMLCKPSQRIETGDGILELEKIRRRALIIRDQL